MTLEGITYDVLHLTTRQPLNVYNIYSAMYFAAHLIELRGESV